MVAPLLSFLIPAERHLFSKVNSRISSTTLLFPNPRDWLVCRVVLHLLGGSVSSDVPSYMAAVRAGCCWGRQCFIMDSEKEDAGVQGWT